MEDAGKSIPPKHRPDELKIRLEACLISTQVTDVLAVGYANETPLVPLEGKVPANTKAAGKLGKDVDAPLHPKVVGQLFNYMRYTW